MNFKDINDSLGLLVRLSDELEDQYIENDGVVTPEAEAMEEEKEAVKHLLQNEGIDALGRYLKTKEDEVKMWKSEKAMADRKVKSAENTIAYIKDKIVEVMTVTKMAVAKGSYYSFTKYVSEKSAVNQEALDAKWKKRVEAAVRHALVPEYIQVVLKSTATDLKDAGGDALDLLDVTKADAVRFTKPRKAE